MQRSNAYCLSSCLTFRYIADHDYGWENGWTPGFPADSADTLHAVASAEDVDSFLRRRMGEICSRKRVGLLLSGGIDSAILAGMMPSSSIAITIRFDAEGAIDESIAAAAYAKAYGLDHHIVRVGWGDYLDNAASLMARKKSMLHAVEVPLFLAATYGRSLGLEGLIIGNGADSTFGGLDQLLSRDYDAPSFMKRYSFIDAASVLKDARPMDGVYAPYAREGSFDVVGFLKTVHGKGIIQAFDNAIKMVGLDIFEPYEELSLGVPLDLARIRAGDSKYLLRDLFRRLYTELAVPGKIAFARPMDVWLRDWAGPKSTFFRQDVDYSKFSGDQKWILHCLDGFIELAGLAAS